jgi:hypothetical protein
MVPIIAPAQWFPVILSESSRLLGHGKIVSPSACVDFIRLERKVSIPVLMDPDRSPSKSLLSGSSTCFEGH